MIPMKVPFAKADLASHILQMCPHTCQDQFNLHKKGMTPVDILSLMSLELEAIEHVCTQEKSNSQSNKKETSNLVLSLRPESQRKFAPR